MGKCLMGKIWVIVRNRIGKTGTRPAGARVPAGDLEIKKLNFMVKMNSILIIYDYLMLKHI